jgi:hypothetical protein
VPVTQDTNVDRLQLESRASAGDNPSHGDNLVGAKSKWRGLFAA